MEIIGLLLSIIPDSDSWERITTAASKQGVTATHQLILHQMTGSLVEVLSPLSLEKRRKHLAVKITWGDPTYAYSSCELAMKPRKNSRQ